MTYYFIFHLSLPLPRLLTLSLLFLLLPAGVVCAQGVADTDTTAKDQRARGVMDDPSEPDSVLQRSVYTFPLRPMSVKIDAISNILLDPTGAHLIDPLSRQRGHYYLSKGALGQSHLDLYPTLGNDIEWHYQPDVNAGYRLTPYNIGFYQTRKPYSLLNYSSSLKKEYTLRVLHTQNITPRWNFALDYTLLNPDPIFSNEDTKNNYLSLTSNYYSSDSRYQAYAALLWQRWNIGENGGLSSDATFRNNTLSDFSGLPVNDYTSRSLYNDWHFYTHQSYNFVRQVQQVRERLELQVNKSDSTLLDTLVYHDTILPAKHHVVNPGVVGLDFSAHRSARRYNSDSTTVHHYMLWLYWTNDAYIDSVYANPLKVTLGAQPHWYRINEKDSLHYHWQNVTATARVALRIGDDTLGTTIYHTLGDALLRNDHLAEAHYTHRFGSGSSLTLSATTIEKCPDFFYLQYHSNGHDWESPHLDKNRMQRYALRYNRGNGLSPLTKSQNDRQTYGIQCEIQANHIERATWLSETDTLLVPTQNSKAFWLLQGRVATQFTLWHWLHCDLEQFLQYSSDDRQYDAPLWATKNTFYADFHLFHRALRMQTGIDIRYHTPYYADSYNAPAGAFVRQRSIEVGNYLWGDLFVNMQVRKVTIYLKAGHLNALWEMNPDYFLLPHYPGNKFGFYYGLTWRFFD